MWVAGGMSCQYLNLLTIGRTNKFAIVIPAKQNKQGRQLQVWFKQIQCKTVPPNWHGKISLSLEIMYQCFSKQRTKEAAKLQAGPWEPVNGKTEGACLGGAGYNGNRKPRQALVPCQFNCWRIRCVVTNSNDTQDGQSVCCVCPVFVCFPRRILRSNCKQDRWHFYTFSLFSVHNHWQKHFRQRVIFSRGHSWYDFFLKRV